MYTCIALILITIFPGRYKTSKPEQPHSARGVHLAVQVRNGSQLVSQTHRTFWQHTRALTNEGKLLTVQQNGACTVQRSESYHCFDMFYLSAKCSGTSLCLFRFYT